MVRRRRRTSGSSEGMKIPRFSVNSLNMSSTASVCLSSRRAVGLCTTTDFVLLYFGGGEFDGVAWMNTTYEVVGMGRYQKRLNLNGDEQMATYLTRGSSQALGRG